jgi:BarA-like signal transduction histidine kinase
MKGNIDGNACYTDTRLQSPLSVVYVQTLGKLAYVDSVTVGITVRVKVDMMFVLKMYHTIRNCCSVLTKRRTICL